MSLLTRNHQRLYVYLRKIPKKTDTIEYANYRFEILATQHLKINQLLVTKLDERYSVTVLK